jgi:hypothetical protein
VPSFIVEKTESKIEFLVEKINIVSPSRERLRLVVGDDEW